MVSMKIELEERINSLEKKFEEVMGAIRRLAQQQVSNIELLSRHEANLADLKTELKKVEMTKNKSMHDNSIERYE